MAASGPTGGDKLADCLGAVSCFVAQPAIGVSKSCLRVSKSCHGVGGVSLSCAQPGLQDSQLSPLGGGQRLQLADSLATGGAQARPGDWRPRWRGLDRRQGLDLDAMGDSAGRRPRRHCSDRGAMGGVRSNSAGGRPRWRGLGDWAGEQVRSPAWNEVG